jgi:hypothetical protein
VVSFIPRQSYYTSYREQRVQCEDLDEDDNAADDSSLLIYLRVNSPKGHENNNNNSIQFLFI